MKVKIAGSLGLLLLAAVLTEVLLRVGFGLGNPIIFQKSPAYGYLPQPDQTTRRFGSNIRINHAGMRSAEFSELKPSATHRILFIGDSVTFGPTFVDQSRLFTTLVPMELRQSRNDEPWESLNASAPGWATGNELGFLKARGTYGADFVVLVINTGDLVQPFAAAQGENTPLQRPPSAIGEAFERYLLPRISAAAKPATDPGSTGSQSAKDSIPVAQVIDNIAEFRQIVQSSGAHFILVYVPAHGKQWEAAHWSAEMKAIIEFVHKTNVQFLDAAALMTASRQAQLQFDGIHLRPAGHAIVADGLVHFLDGAYPASAPRLVP